MTKTIVSLAIRQASALRRNHGMSFRRFTNPDSFDGTRETYEANISFAVFTLVAARSNANWQRFLEREQRRL